MITILNNLSAMSAENSLTTTQASLQKTLNQLSTGLRINTGSDDAAGLSIGVGMQANIAALTQSSRNATDGAGQLQTADGALSQVTSLLNRAVTLATEAANGDINSSQGTALDTEFSSIKAEINQIGLTTDFNGQDVFSATPASTFMSDGVTLPANATVSTTIGVLSSTSLSLNTNDLTSQSNAGTALTAINAAINAVSASRGSIGASVNRLTAASTVMTAQVENLTSASNDIMNADMGKTVANMAQYNILQSTGMAALQQANNSQQSVLKLLQ